MKDKINKILEKNFIYIEPIADILAAAIYAKQNVILFGPGGHGKSEMVEAVLEGLGLWSRAKPTTSSTLIQSFGEGLTEDALWGGIDFSKLNHPTEPDMVFNISNSFLNYPVAVFEELFDAPPFCLLPLKHTLQAGFLGKNGKAYPMHTQLIIACTNRTPDDIGEMGETYRALLERFVLRQEVIWENYNSDAYISLLAKHKELHISSTDLRVFASLMSDCQDSGFRISPRTAMKAADVLMGAARSRGSNTVAIEDFAALKHVVGFQQMAVRFQQSILNKKNEAEAEGRIISAQESFNTLNTLMNSGAITKVVEWCVMAKKFLNMQTDFGGIPVPDTMFERRQALIQAAGDAYTTARDRAIAETRV